MLDLPVASAIGQAAWTDLLRLLKQEAVAGVSGTPRLRKIGAKAYWYEEQRLGDQRLSKFIGEDTAELRERLDRRRTLKDRTQDRDRERSRLVRLLRAEGYGAPDVTTGQALLAMSKAGAFRLGGTLVGTHAFRLYEGVLGYFFAADDMAVTDDIDIASFEKLSLVLGDTVAPSLPEVFSKLKFDPVPSLHRKHIWRWRQTKRQTLVEFLTPSFEADEPLKELPALGVSAQSLHFLNFLIADPIRVPALYRRGVLVQIPRPERYAVHKLIVASRRREGPMSAKARKDRDQAARLIEILAEEDPDALIDAYTAAREKGPKWRALLDRSLKRLPETHAKLTGSER
ncbi:MAG: GSU2403 family nucleotidyltransferase fold protein [Pseudomonadota bacterium]